MELKLENKKILITGASKGLGSVCAKALSDNDACLALLARSKEKLENVRKNCKNPEKHISIAVDLTNINELHESVQKAKIFLGEINVILHVAGGGLGLKDPLIHYNDLLKLFTLNVSSAAEINRIIIPDMIKKRTGNIVHVGSTASRENTGSVGYNTVKAALSAYVRSLGRETAIHNVIITGILPGGFYAPENSWEKLKKDKPEIVDKWIEENLPRKYMGDAKEIIPFILLLCSNSASMMGGCLIPIDAGQGKSY